MLRFRNWGDNPFCKYNYIYVLLMFIYQPSIHWHSVDNIKYPPLFFSAKHKFCDIIGEEV